MKKLLAGIELLSKRIREYNQRIERLAQEATACQSLGVQVRLRY
jgi:hypothetical protein